MSDDPIRPALRCKYPCHCSCLQSYEDRVDDLEDALAQAKAEIEGLQREKQQMALDALALEGQLMDLEAQARQLRADKGMLKSELERIKRQRQSQDPHLTVLSPEAFDALLDALDNPESPSAQALENVRRARLWPKKTEE